MSNTLQSIRGDQAESPWSSADDRFKSTISYSMHQCIITKQNGSIIQIGMGLGKSHRSMQEGDLAIASPDVSRRNWMA